MVIVPSNKNVGKPTFNFTDFLHLILPFTNSALKVKREIKNKLVKQGYKIPNHLIPMKEVVYYLDIDIPYLESRLKKGSD